MCVRMRHYRQHPRVYDAQTNTPETTDPAFGRSVARNARARAPRKARLPFLQTESHISPACACTD